MNKYLSLSLLLCSLIIYNSSGQTVSNGQLPYTSLPFQIKWSQQTEQPKDDVLTACAEAANGDIIGVGSIVINKKNTDALITLLSPQQRREGQPPLSTSFGGEGYEEIFDVCPTADGGYLVVGQTQGGQNTGHPFLREGYTWLFKLNSQGELQWQQLLAAKGSTRLIELIALDQEQYLAVGERSDSLWLYRFREDGKFVAQYTMGGSGQRYTAQAATLQGKWIGICGNQQGRRQAQPFFLALPIDKVFERGFRRPRPMILDNFGSAVGVAGTGNRFVVVSNRYMGDDQDIVAWEIDWATGKQKVVLDYRGWGQDTASDIIRSKRGDYFIVGHTRSFPRDASFQDNPLFLRLTPAPDYKAEWMFDYQAYPLNDQRGLLNKLALTDNQDVLLAGAIGNKGKQRDDGWLLRVGLPEARSVPVPVLAFVYDESPIILNPVEREVPLHLCANVHNFGDTTAYDVQVRLNPPYMIEHIGPEVQTIDSIPPGQTRGVLFKYQIGPFFAPSEYTLYTVLWEDQYGNHDAIAHLKRIIPYAAVYRPSSNDYYIPEDSPNWLDIPHGPNAEGYGHPPQVQYLINWVGYSESTLMKLADEYIIYDDYIVLRAGANINRPLDTSDFKINISVEEPNGCYELPPEKMHKQSTLLEIDSSWLFICKIRLKEGLNTIQLSLDTDWKSSPIHIRYEPPPVHFILLSIPYENIDTALYNRINTLGNYLTEQTRSQHRDRIYSDLQPAILHDSSDTHAAALQLFFGEISKKRGNFKIENHHRVIFLSFSHGVKMKEDDNRFYIYPSEFKDEKNLYDSLDASRMINFEEDILRHLIESNCRKLITLIDACEGGALTKQMDGEIDAVPCIEDIPESDTISSAVPNQLYVLASTSGSAWAVKENGDKKATASPFIDALICAFTGECLEDLKLNYPNNYDKIVLNNDGIFSINELFHFCEAILAKQIPEQNPAMNSKNMDDTAVFLHDH